MSKIINNNTFDYIRTARFWHYFFFIFLISSNLFLLIKNYSYIYESIKIGVSFFDSIFTIYDLSNTFTVSTFLIIFITLILSSLNISLLIKYFSLQAKVNNNLKDHNGKKMGLAMTLAYIASHCASCGAAILGGLVSTSLLSYLPFAGLEIGLVGILIMLYISYDIIKKINNPYVC